MASSSPRNSSKPDTSEIETNLKRKSNDMCWEYGVLNDPNNLDKIQCKLCGKVVSAGIHRLKEHITHILGNVSACFKSSAEDQAKGRNAIYEAKNKKIRQRRREQELRDNVVLEKDASSIGETFESPTNSLGPMDKFAATINPESSINVAKTTREQTINDVIWKERSDVVKNYLADWMYEAGIAFNAINIDSFKIFVEVLGQFGRGWRSPSQYELRESLLKNPVERTKDKANHMKMNGKGMGAQS